MSIKDDWQKFSIGEKIIFAVGTALIPMLAVLILFLYSIAFKSEIASAKRYAKDPSKILAAIRKALKPKKTQNSRTYRRKYTPTELCYARIYTISFRRSKNFFSASSDANRVCNTNMNCIPRRAIPYQISACSRFIGNSRLYKTCTNGIKQSLCY